MKKHFILLLIAFTSSYWVSGQGTWRKAGVKPVPVVWYASGKVEKAFVPPPINVLNRLKSGKEKTCQINVTYTGFPDSAKIAFEYAVSIWEQLISSSVPINLSVSWQDMGANLLGSCTPADYYQNLDNLYYSNFFYPVAIAERLAGKDLGGTGVADIVASFNKNVNWYFGTDGHTPLTKYDFVSTALHEITHGLGFTGFFYTSIGMGVYDVPPAVFDRFVTESPNQQLIDTHIFGNPSTGLYNALTSNAIYFRGPAALYDGNGSAPKLYAPRKWTDGSSIYHLDPYTYPVGNINSLMTPAAGMGEAIHNPGPVTLDILADMGWNTIKIKSKELKDIEQVINPVYIEASIESDYALDSASLYLYYSTDNFSSVDSARLEPSDSATYFKAELPVTITSGTISYYISAADVKQRVFNDPPEAPVNSLKLRIGPDQIKPVIKHKPADYVLSTAPKLNIDATASDNIGVDSVWVEFLVNGQYKLKKVMKKDSTNSYSTAINLFPYTLNETDTISYRIVARDISSNRNIAYLPSEGYFKLRVEKAFAPLTKYFTDFNDTTSEDFLSAGLKIEDVSGFIDGALHSPHPYLSPEKADTSFNYSALLRYPIILEEGGQMNYDEIVLVEPGASGAVYGDADFWDYVIAEGSKDYGKTWLPLTDGYDSGSNANWLTEYNNGIGSSGNSSTIGTKEMFIRKNIDLLANGNFSAGDTIFIRFRLFSDPFANGWGWTIDNLRIQSIVPVQDIMAVSPGDFIIYPNPFKGQTTLELNSNIHFKDISVAVFDSYGRLIFNEPVSPDDTGFTQNLNLKSWPAGMYYIQVFADGKKVLSRKLIKQ